MYHCIKKHSNLFIIISFLILAWLSIILFLNTHSLMGTGDMPMHLHQLREAQMALQHHVLSYYGINEFHGSAIMTLYPWLNLWPAIVLADFVKNKIMVIYLYFFLNEFLVLMISYFSSLNFDKSKRISYLFAIFYGLSTLYVDYGFADMDWGELLTMTFLPLVIFGMIALLQHGNWLELSAGMTLIILSHVLNTVLIISLLILILVINVRKLNLKVVINLIKAVILTTFVTIFVWLPAFKVVHFNRPISVPPKRALFGSPFMGLVNDAIKGNISYGPSIIAIIGIILGACYFLRLNRYTKQWYIISLLTVICCSAWFPWQLMPKKLMTIQFTWRLYLIPEMCLCYVTAIAINYMVQHHPILKNFVLGMLIIITMAFQFESQKRVIDINLKAPILSQQYLDHNYFKYGRSHYVITRLRTHPHGNIKTPLNFRLTTNNSYDAMFDQKRFLKMDGYYWPLSAKKHYSDINDRLIRSDQGLTGKVYNTGYNRFTFNNNHTLTHAYLPLLKYTGEQMRLNLDGHPSIAKSRQHVLYMNKIPKGIHHLAISFRMSHTYLLSMVTLILGALIYLALMIVKFTKYLQRLSI